MPREIKKKILEKELDDGTPSLELGAQAANLAGGMEAMAVAASAPPRSGSSMSLGPESSQGGKKLDSGFEFSLDDFDPPEERGSPESQASGELAQTDEQPAAAVEGERAAESIQVRAQPRKIAIFAAACILPVLLGFWALKHWSGKTEAPKPPIVTRLVRPIVIPHFSETLEFLVMTSQQNEKRLLLISFELSFSNEERHSRFMQEIVLVRDLIFNFLAAQRPSKNSEGEWVKIVGNDLTGYLKSATPQCRADAIRLNSVARL